MPDLEWYWWLAIAWALCVVIGVIVAPFAIRGAMVVEFEDDELWDEWTWVEVPTED